MQKALSLDSENASAYLARGRVLWTPGKNWPHEAVIKDYRHAIELDPNLAEARNQLAVVYSHIGLLDEALVQAHKGVELDPTNNLLYLRIGQTLNSQMKFEEALSVLSAIPIEIHPSVIGHQTAWALFNLGRTDEALAKIEQLESVNEDKGGTFAAMKAVIAASRGNSTEAEKLIEQAVEKGKGYGHFHHTAYTIACAYALMNKPTEAIHFLEQAAETGFPCYPQFERDKNLNNLRKDPRFVTFLANQKQQWEHYKSL
jgi:tetratricopeptide (TPR) repeat protein